MAEARQHPHQHHQPQSQPQQPSSVILRPRQSLWPAISMDDALSIVVAQAEPVMSKSVPANLVRPGMVLYDPVIAKTPIPPARTSIKDGYAVIGKFRK